MSRDGGIERKRWWKKNIQDKQFALPCGPHGGRTALANSDALNSLHSLFVFSEPRAQVLDLPIIFLDKRK